MWGPVPSNTTMPSFARTPPRWAGSPGMTSRTSTPRASRSLSLSTSSSVISAMDTPSQPHSTRPFAASCGTSCLTRFDGIAKPIEMVRAAMLLTPTTSPAMFTSGPPEFPGLIAASVWMKSKPGAAIVRGAPLRAARARGGVRQDDPAPVDEEPGPGRAPWLAPLLPPRLASRRAADGHVHEPGLEPRGQVREQRVDALELRRRAGIRARERTPTPGAGRAAAAEREHDDEQQGAHTDRSEPRHLDPPLHGAPPSIRR